MTIQTIARYIAGYFIGIVIFLLALPYGIYWLSCALPAIQLPVDEKIRFAVALVLGVAGLLFGFWSNASLFIQGGGGPTDAFNIAVSPRTKHLVMKGPYRYCRNPMAFGAFSFYFALAVFFNSLPTMAVLVLFLTTMRFYIKATEEKRLQNY